MLLVASFDDVICEGAVLSHVERGRAVPNDNEHVGQALNMECLSFAGPGTA